MNKIFLSICFFLFSVACFSARQEISKQDSSASSTSWEVKDEKIKKRSIRISDGFEEQRLRAVTFSPDGRALAFTKERSKSSQRFTGLITENVLKDVWVQDVP